MFEVLNPEFIVSSGIGGAAAYGAIKTHLHFVWREFEKQENINAVLFERLRKLEQK